jgi:RNA polymerase subunit RPABC4/transcription elongation factor Spt4
MQQGLTCPNCGSPVNASQQFCGVCGTKVTAALQQPPLSSVPPQQPPACPNCGTPIKPDQPFCGLCGTKLTGSGQQPPVMMQQPPVAPPLRSVPPPSPPMMAPPITKPGNIPPPKGPAPRTETQQVIQPERSFPAKPAPAIKRRRQYSILTIAGALFQVVGWIVLIGGVLTSIGLLIFISMGGKFESAIPGMSGTIQGSVALIMGLASIICSIVWGIGLLAFAEICYAVITLSKKLE